MSASPPAVPKGTGKSPVMMVVISAKDLPASSAFYSKVFGWQFAPMSAAVSATMPPAGPTVALRSDISDGFPGMVPYVGTTDVKASLDKAVAAGGRVEKAPWNAPMVGTLARFKDPSGTIYGLTDAQAPNGVPHLPIPFGSNPKPPDGTICSLEMYAKDGDDAAKYFGELFGWGTLATMPMYMTFDPGAGVGGVFQSHTPTTPAVGYIYAADVDATLAAIEAAGGKRMGDPMRMPGMACFGYFKDPSGTAMGLIGA